MTTHFSVFDPTKIFDRPIKVMHFLCTSRLFLSKHTQQNKSEVLLELSIDVLR